MKNSPKNSDIKGLETENIEILSGNFSSEKKVRKKPDIRY